MEHRNSQAQEVEIRRLREEITEARMQHMIAEMRLRYVLQALEHQTETFDLVTRNVASMLAIIDREAESDQIQLTTGVLPKSV